MKSKKRHGNTDKSMRSSDPFTRDKPFTKATFRPEVMKEAIGWALDKYEREREFKAQHGPVRIIMAKGKLVGDGDSGGEDGKL